MARRWPLLLAVALLVGAVAAFSYTEKLKLTRAPVGVPRFDRWLAPGCDCPQGSASLSFLVRKPQRIDVDVVDRDGDPVRTLASGVRRPVGRVEYEWDGRDDAGAAVADGPYRVRVRLLDDRRTIVIPVDVNVDTRPPRLTDVRVAPTTVAVGEEVGIRFATSEFGRPLVVVDGEVAASGPVGRAGVRRAFWTPSAPGSYEVAVAFEDRAGNVSEPAGATQVDRGRSVSAAPPVLILGVRRSGTTLLRVVLDRCRGAGRAGRVLLRAPARRASRGRDRRGRLRRRPAPAPHAARVGRSGRGGPPAAPAGNAARRRDRGRLRDLRRRPREAALGRQDADVHGRTCRCSSGSSRRRSTCT